jgi:hypothetical protein
VEKLSHHRSSISVEFDRVLKLLLVGIEFRVMSQMFLVHGGVWHLANVQSLDSHMPDFLKGASRQSCPVLSQWL